MIRADRYRPAVCLSALCGAESLHIICLCSDQAPERGNARFRKRASDGISLKRRVDALICKEPMTSIFGAGANSRAVPGETDCQTIAKPRSGEAFIHEVVR